MQVLAISTTIIDLSLQKVPFLSNYTIAIMNGTSGAISLQESDTDSGFAELAAIPATGMAEVTLSKRYIKAASGILYAFGT